MLTLIFIPFAVLFVSSLVFYGVKESLRTKGPGEHPVQQITDEEIDAIFANDNNN